MEIMGAMKQALEALESAKNNHGKLLLSDPPQDAWRFHRVDDAVSASITALRQAIEQAEHVHAVNTSQERVDEIVKTEHDKQIEIAQAYERGWNAALAQQEPMAWISEGGDVSRSKRYMDEMGFKCNPLYTAPPQRKPLTDEHILLIANRLWEIKIPSDSWLWFARAIEAAHGIGEKA
jgi:hypothetical protein